MDIVQALMLSIIEGVTEFLPISSTGHLILASKILQIPQTEFTKSFEIIIQSGAIMAVALAMIRKTYRHPKFLITLMYSLIPTVIVGAILYKTIKLIFMENTMITVISLGIGGLALIVWELSSKNKKQDITSIYDIPQGKSIGIGLGQAVAVIPGISRAAATIVTASMLGMKREAAVEYSFFLAVPTIIAASLFDYVQSAPQFSSDQYILIVVGLIGSFISAWVTTSYFLKYVRSHTLIPFGIYRIIIAIVFFIYTL